MKCYLEHANISVRSLDNAIRFLSTAFPHFKVRGKGESSGKKWIHIGTDDTYIAFSEANGGVNGPVAYSEPGINHIGFVVNDAETIRTALLEAGYREGFVADPHPHRKRIYFHDGDDNEWEFVEYFSDNPAERNDYTT